MTCREKLKKEHPELVDKNLIGGCEGCPTDYGYIESTRCRAAKSANLNETCTECWDQEVFDPSKPRGTVYISGPITGVEKYWEAFEKAEDELSARGWIVLTPSRHPTGLTNAQYMRMDLAMIDSADAVFFLPGWEESKGARLEWLYCEYIQKPHSDDINSLEVRSK